jgi:hypothetical protein
MKAFITLLIISLSSISNIAFSQFYFAQTTGKTKIEVSKEEKKVFQFPWTGGMNSCQFNEIDLNLDGINDLLVFDRNGNRMMPFINNGTPGTSDYEFAPDYIASFPEIVDWLIMADYNMDGKNDLFTYSPGWAGIKVFKNVSTTTLDFEPVVYPYLKSFQGSGYVNILVTYADYPAITDIDSDGDLDILTFWGLGSFVEFHENQSMDLYGIPDSLDFIETSSCWGHFAENDESNIIYLDTCNISKGDEMIIPKDNTERHTGSTFFIIDLDGDEDKDLVLGDVDYPNLIQLMNDGDADEAHIGSQDAAFPSYDIPIDLFSMPLATSIDIDNDNTKEMLVSPFDPSIITSENYKSSWLYENSGTNEQPHFNFVQNNFLQDEMIDLGAGAYPVLADYDQDGLNDLFVSNFGYYMYSYYGPGMFLKSVYWSNIALFRNSGTATEPSFELVTRDFVNLHDLHLKAYYPTFGDLDGDNDEDMIIGYAKGTLMYLENIAAIGQPMEFANPVLNYQQINIGEYSTPQLIDLNEDGLLDLAIGEKAGNLNYYENTGSAQNPVFSFVTDSLGKVLVTDFNLSYDGYSTPCFFKDQQNKFKLIVGSEQGKLFYYENIEGNLEGEFTESDSLYLIIGGEAKEIDPGIRTAAAIQDLDQDGYFDLIAGNYSGGLNYFSGADSPGVIGIEKQNLIDGEISIYPNPTKAKFVIENKEGGSLGEINIYNIYGELILSSIANQKSIQLDLGKFNAGVYLIGVSSLDDKTNNYCEKVIIQK